MFMDTYCNIFVYTIVAFFILLAILILISLCLAIKEQKKCDKILKNSQERINYNNDYINYYKGLYKTTLQELNHLKKVHDANQTSDKNNSVQSSSTFNNLEDEVRYYQQVYSSAIQDIKNQTEQNCELRFRVRELQKELTSLQNKIEGSTTVTDLTINSCEKTPKGYHHQQK
ncbi:hypothetical protein IMW62_02170 [Ehrlichia ruminantium]|uniref:Uncharacterized protein n=2 Tax=Ehrlichia ruminantium TaxID=779 RepID=A0A0H3M630_EHRRW|nr:hypothetical protein FDZ62_02180 [Ehrlichia ruminantium]UOE00080.1 hypothetical protein IMW62_02170 [Ehrlichia ruminantium]CAH58108.1 putative membrane protein [Ehrlichia ruminantium str. Welgevonden]CAI26892.1 Hypothetical protein ERWE_CDS_03980 [Ehrlichia ruminantium str. Welgevonden]